MADNAPKYDPFILEQTFPDPESVLKTLHSPVNKLTDNCLYALDANILLHMYLLDGDGLKDVEKHFRQLVAADRLFLPAQAVREFGRHRSGYVARAFEDLSKLTTLYPPMPKALDTPAFRHLPEHKDAAGSIDAVRKAIGDYKAKLDKLVEAARYIGNNDAVSVLIAELFSGKHVIDHGLTKEDVLKDLAHRQTHSLPPGTKDKDKADGGIGDLLIWHSLVKLAKDKKRDVVFVSDDSKMTGW